MNKHSYLLRETMQLIYPLIIIFGIYIILNGHNTPGGGFQGGAILASTFIIHYLVTFEQNMNLKLLTLIEKFLYLLLLLFAVVFILYFNNYFPFITKQMYMIIMNILIGIKVCCGLSVIFFRFIFFESR